MSAVHLTKADFLTRVANYEVNPNEWKFLGERPALIDFYATWCGPCKMLAPVLDELADEYAGQVDIYKVNVDEEEELAALFGIRSVPSLLFVPMNGTPQMAQGALPKKNLKEAIQNVLLKTIEVIYSGNYKKRRALELSFFYGFHDVGRSTFGQ